MLTSAGSLWYYGLGSDLAILPSRIENKQLKISRPNGFMKGKWRLEGEALYTHVYLRFIDNKK
jgi:hypothetical protein